MVSGMDESNEKTQKFSDSIFLFGCFPDGDDNGGDGDGMICHKLIKIWIIFYFK